MPSLPGVPPLPNGLLLAPDGVPPRPDGVAPRADGVLLPAGVAPLEVFACKGGVGVSSGRG